MGGKDSGSIKSGDVGGEMAWQVKGCAAEPDDPSSFPGIHMGEGNS